MKKVINTFFDDEIARERFCSGLIFELEDGRFLVHHQDGYVTPISWFLSEPELNTWIEKSTKALSTDNPPQSNPPQGDMSDETSSL